MHHFLTCIATIFGSLKTLAYIVAAAFLVSSIIVSFIVAKKRNIALLHSSVEWIEKHHNKLYLVAVLMQIAGMLIAFSLYGIVISPDSSGYIAPAQSFLAQGIMLSDNAPIFFRTPGYPLLLALVYSLSDNSNFAVVVVQALMSIVTGSMIYSTVKSVSQDKLLSLCSLFLWSFCDLNYYYSCSILTEIPFIFFFILSVFLGCKYFYSKKPFCYIIFSFLSFNFAMLIRPSIMYLGITLAILFLFAATFRKISWKVALAYLCIFAVSYGGWSLRNYNYYGAPLFTSVRYTSYYLWYAPETYRIAERSSLDEASVYFSAQLNEQYPNYDNLSALEQIYAQADIGKEYVKKHFDSYLILNLRGLILEMLSAFGIAIAEAPLLVRFLSYVFSSSLPMLLYVIYAYGFLKHIRKLTALDWLLFFTNAYLIAGHAVLGYNRFRMSFFATCIIGGLISWRSDLLASNSSAQSNID